MSEKIIVIESKGIRAIGTVTKKSKVTAATKTEINHTVSNGMDEIAKILEGKGVEDPSRQKCTSCEKKGRQPFHKIDEFSVLQSGKRLSQCKVCRTEQSVAWQIKKKEERRLYHRNYAKIRNKPVKRIPEMKILDSFDDDRKSTKDSLFVVYTSEEVADTV